MDYKAIAKVSAFFVVAALVLGGWVLYLAHIKPGAYKVRASFKDMKGLLSGSQVRMQGVTVGEVKRVDLDTNALTADGRFPDPVVTLLIDSKYRIPDDSIFRVASGILITNPTVEITPGRARTSLARDDTARVQGAESGGALATLSPELQETVTKLNGEFSDIQKKINGSYGKINKILDQTQTLLHTSNDSIAAAKNIIADPQIKAKLVDTLENFRQSSGQARLATVQLRGKLNGLLDSGRGTFDETKESLLNIFDRIDTTLDDANTVVKKLTEQVTDPRLQQSLQETTELARTTLARFNQLASDLHQFTGDPALQDDLKTTIANLKSASASGQEAVGRLNNLIGKIPGANATVAGDGTTGSGATNGTGNSKPGRLLRFPPINVQMNASEQFDPSHFRVDAEARIPFGQRSFLNLGIYDIEHSRLILQAGTRMGSGFTSRYGLYAGKIGLGLDYAPANNFYIRSDLFDANRPRLDIRTGFRVNKNASFWIGTDGLLRRPVPRIGIELNP